MQLVTLLKMSAILTEALEFLDQSSTTKSAEITPSSKILGKIFQTLGQLQLNLRVLIFVSNSNWLIYGYDWQVRGRNLLVYCKMSKANHTDFPEDCCYGPK